MLNNLKHLLFQHQLTKISKKQAKNNIKLCFENRPKAHQKIQKHFKITKTKNNLKLCFDKWLKHSKTQKQFKISKTKNNSKTRKSTTTKISIFFHYHYVLIIMPYPLFF